MERRLDDEYKKYVLTDTPDLWDKIEAGIDAGIDADSANGDDNVVDNAYADKASLIRKNSVRYLKFIIPTAAVLLISVFALSTTRSNRFNKSETYDLTTAAEVFEESAEEAEDDFAAESAEDYSLGASSAGDSGAEDFSLESKAFAEYDNASDAASSESAADMGDGFSYSASVVSSENAYDNAVALEESADSIKSTDDILIMTAECRRVKHVNKGIGGTIYTYEYLFVNNDEEFTVYIDDMQYKDLEEQDLIPKAGDEYLLYIIPVDVNDDALTYSLYDIELADGTY